MPNNHLADLIAHCQYKAYSFIDTDYNPARFSVLPSSFLPPNMWNFYLVRQKSRIVVPDTGFGQPCSDALNGKIAAAH